MIPNLVLLPPLLADGWDVHYIGSRGGIEENLVRGETGVTYHVVSTGKMRRYRDLKNLSDPFRVVGGIGQSARLISRLKPRVIFSKGGFVAVPVILGGSLNSVPSVIHESDRTPGLANKICAPFAKRICCSFEKTPELLPVSHRKKAVYTGAPVRPILREGNEKEGRRLCGFDTDAPVLLVMGGSLGSVNLNRIVRAALPRLLSSWNVAHICGKGNRASDAEVKGYATHAGLAGRYAQIEYADDTTMAHLYKMSRYAVSRAGSSAVFELLELGIPSVLIPLPLTQSRGDQIQNALEFEKKGFCVKLDESDCEAAVSLLTDAIDKLKDNHDRFAKALRCAKMPDAASLILKEIYAAAALPI